MRKLMRENFKQIMIKCEYMTSECKQMSSNGNDFARQMLGQDFVKGK